MSNLFDDDGAVFDLSEVTSSSSVAPSNVIVFKPWHKPRKQYVRHNQWWLHLDSLIKRSREYNDISTIKYFGLPGSDLLDINFFSKKMLTEEKFNSKKLLVHGFIDTALEKEKADLRLTELLDRTNVDRDSKVEHYNFHALARKDSLAFRQIKQSGAYHLINLDFCDGIFKQETINAMMELLTIQFNKMLDTPWLLFLTTRADKEGIAQDLLSNLDKIFRDEASDDETFISTLEEYHRDIYEFAKDKKSISDVGLSKTHLSEILQACFIYWAIRLTHAYGARMKTTSIMKYKVHGGNEFPDMFSYVIKFNKKAKVISDSLGLAKKTSQATPELSDEEKASDLKFSISKLCRSVDIDALLVDDIELYNLYAKDMKCLLIESGWDVTTYDEEMRR